MKHFVKAVAAILFAGTTSAFCGSDLTVPDVTVGRNLQMYTSVTLPAPAPPEGMQLTVTSGDPKRLLLSAGPEQAGSASITLTAKVGFVASPEFWVQGLADTGTVTYTVTAKGVGSGKGTVTLVPSTVVILGPFKAPSFETTPGGHALRLTVISAVLDSAMKASQEQQVAGGTSLAVRIDNSHSEFGTVHDSTVTLTGGASEVVTSFQAAAEGQTTLTPVQPPGFRTAAERASVVAIIKKPGVGVSEDLIVGKDLQVNGVACLGEPAGPKGVTITLTSSDPAKLLLSAAADKLGAGSITLTVPPGQSTAEYFLQGLGDSGKITYEATAPGFRSQTAHMELTTSGIIVGYSKYGPPDEAAVKLRRGEHQERSFYASLADSKKNPIHLKVWSAYLDGGLAADFTVQALRPGVSATVILKSSDPAVGTVESTVTITPGSSNALAVFTPNSAGPTVITVSTPSGFTTPKNATHVPAVVVN
jgi:hypothetical protein